MQPASSQAAPLIRSTWISTLGWSLGLVSGRFKRDLKGLTLVGTQVGPRLESRLD